MPEAKRRRRILKILAALLALGLAVPVLARWHITASTAAHRIAIEHAPRLPVAIVLGAAIPNNKPSNMLEDRLAAAAELYHTGRCKKILVSGAHHRVDHNEVAVMARWLEQHGVPPEAIAKDHAGLRTLDSMVRAKQVFGVHEALVVTQAFHLPRAVYLGQHAGLDITGVAAPELYVYPAPVMWKHEAREFVAQSKALLDLWVLGTEPKFIGPRIHI